MSLKLLYITNKTEIASLADRAGIDRIFIDLEIKGKEERQGHLNTVISRHSTKDIKKIKDVLTFSQLLVRINPINKESKKEIDLVIEGKADIIMLPMFSTADEVREFIRLVDKRAKTCLLLETAAAAVRIDEILDVPGIDEIHIGLNDLHIDMKLTFMFELLSCGFIDYLAQKIKAHNIPFGFGGIARIGYGELPAEYIITEHYRIGSCMAILSRSFCDANKRSADEVIEDFTLGIKRIREFEKSVSQLSDFEYNENHARVISAVKKIAEKKSR